MVTILLGNSCTSCRKTKAWFQAYDIPFSERNIDHEPLTKEELKQLITLCPNGVDKIISRKSKIYQKLNIDFEELSFNQLLVLLNQYTKLVKRPIIYDDKKIQIGFNEEEIRTLLPQEIKQRTRNYLYKVNTTMLYEDLLALQKTEYFS
ncbi:transcriptional regulator Spx [Enterococcus raffinosus]|uniref:transcriptional regulator Spx n=1 Tax=Enterococcus raffinosus TaxID=71452 RepID=UPI002673BF77|nr:transcriptional regulator Spx [Enterococcus raffinosus]